MELVEELKKPAKLIIGVLTGNGRREYRMLRAITKKYDGSEKLLYFPRRPGYLPGAKLSVLQVVKVYVSKYKINNFLCIIDKEHFTETDIEKEVKEKIREFGIEVTQIQMFDANTENAIYLNGTVGPHNFILWMVIAGKEKCIEEDLAKLIEIKFGDKIEPTKSNIIKALRRYNVDTEKLMASASIEQLRQSFPALDFVLSRLEPNTTIEKN